MGLAFKPDIDDLRESPAVHVANALKDEGGMDVLFVEPNIKSHRDFTITPVDSACDQADSIVYLVKHKEFLQLGDLNGVVLDFCGIGASGSCS